MLKYFTFFQNVNEDIATEREVYEQSRQGLDSMYTESQKKLMEETQAREVCVFLVQVLIIIILIEIHRLNFHTKFSLCLYLIHQMPETKHLSHN